ncbi:putative ankyrin repeat protein [Paramyrothecium foliicola]|nr:putative ankyrin repeat protein [Paramyrothecium foliicola]
MGDQQHLHHVYNGATKMTDKLPIRGRSANLGHSGTANQSPRGRPTSQILGGSVGGRPQPSRRLSIHGPSPTISAPSRPGARRAQSHEPATRYPSLSSPVNAREARGRGGRSPNTGIAGRTAATPRSLQSPSRYGRPEEHLRPSGLRRDSYGSPSSLAGRLRQDEQRPAEGGRRYSFSPSSARPASGQRTYSSEHLSPPLRSTGRFSSPLSPTSPSSPRWSPTDPYRTRTPPRQRPLYAEGRGSSSRRTSFGEPVGHRSADSRRHSIKSAGPASSRESSRGRRGNFLSSLATVAGIEGLVNHVTTAQQWSDWLSDLQDSPEEIRSLSDKATTARDTIAQIEGTLAARPDLLEGESGQRLKQHIEDAISSTNETLGIMTRLLADISQTTAEEGTVLRGLQEYWNSYRYKSEWGNKLKEVEGQLQSQLALLSTLMINIYSRALTKPAPAEISVEGRNASMHGQASKPGLGEAEPKHASSGTDDAPSIQQPSTNNDTNNRSSEAGATDKIDASSDDPPPATKKPLDQSNSRPTEPATGHKQLHAAADSSVRPGTGMAETPSMPSPKIVELPPSQDGPDETRRQSNASAITDSDDPVETLLDAAWSGDLEAVTRALQHTPATSYDTRGMTPLHYAAERDRLAIAMLLLDRGADPNSAAERARTPLHLAARAASADMVEMLLERAGADPNARASDGKTPLHYAASSAKEGDEERRDVIRVLRDWKADPTIQDRRGDTARDVAQKRDYWDAAATLRRAEKRWEESHHQNWFHRHGLKT